MNVSPSITTGGSHTDHRGTIRFMNEFDMSQIKRFYIIQNENTSIVRAWRAHKIEQRWFCALEGAFLIRLVKIDDWQTPSADLPIEDFTISADKNEVLHIPKGYGSSVQAVQDNSKLIVFADHGIDHAKDDDYLFPADLFDVKS